MIGFEYKLCKVGRRKITLIKGSCHKPSTTITLFILCSERYIVPANIRFGAKKINFALHCEKMNEIHKVVWPLVFLAGSGDHLLEHHSSSFWQHLVLRVHLLHLGAACSHLWHCDPKKHMKSELEQQKPKYVSLCV